MKHLTWIAAIALGLAQSPVLASDHIDGEVTKNHALSDLSDLYAFPTPGKPGFLTIALNTHPFATKKNHFSAKVNYRITLRKATLDSSRARIGTESASERVLLFTFDDQSEPHTMTCSVGGLRHTVLFNGVDSEFKDGLRLFAGRRSDTFFFNALWAGKTAGKGKLPKPARSNSMKGLSTLSMVVDVEVSKLFGADVSLLAIVAESVNAKTKERFDRVGRPEVTNVTMVNHGDEADLRDRFNGVAPFAFSAEDSAAFSERFVKNIGYYDALDGTTEWTAEEATRYAALIADDFLLVDVSKPESAEEGYFAIEKALLAGKPHTSAGGRKLTDDIMDSLFTTLINHDEGARIRDGADAPHMRPSAEFPYLRETPFGFWNWIKIPLLRKLSGVPSSAYLKNKDGGKGVVESLDTKPAHDHGDGSHDHGH